MSYALKILWLDQAVVDLTGIRLYLEQFSQAAALRIVSKLYHGVEPLATMPRMYQEIKEIEHLRRIVIEEYSIFYRIDEEKKIVKIEYVRRHSQDSRFLT